MFCWTIRLFKIYILLEKNDLPWWLKSDRLSLVFKGGNRSKLGNYRPISVLPCFSKIPERIMYDCFHKCVLENKILYPKKYGFQVGHSKNYLYKVFLFYIFKTCTTHYRSGRTEVFCANAVLKLMINNVNKILGKLSESKFAS